MTDNTAVPSLRELIRADFDQAAHQGAGFRLASSSRWRRIGMALEPPLFCVLLHRFAHAAWQRGAYRTARALATVNRILLRAEIDPACEIGPGLYIPHPSAVMLSATAGRSLIVFANAIVAPEDKLPHLAGAAPRGPRLGDDVAIGFNALVLGTLSIGDGARIGGGAVVRGDIPARAICRSPFRGVREQEH